LGLAVLHQNFLSRNWDGLDVIYSSNEIVINTKEATSEMFLISITCKRKPNYIWGIITNEYLNLGGSISCIILFALTSKHFDEIFFLRWSWQSHRNLSFPNFNFAFICRSNKLISVIIQGEPWVNVMVDLQMVFWKDLYYHFRVYRYTMKYQVFLC